MLGECAQAPPFGQILAQQSVGVLVGGALPGVMRRREVDLRAQPSLELFIQVKLGAVVGGDGADRMRFLPKQRRGAVERLLCTDDPERKNCDAKPAAAKRRRVRDCRARSSAFATVRDRTPSIGQPVATANALTGPAISQDAPPLDGALSFEENRLHAPARLSCNDGRKIMRITVILCLALTWAGCSHQEPVLGVGGQSPKFGDYSRSEVEALRDSIAKLTFPVPEHTLEKMLPKHIEPLPVSFVDWVPDREKKGKVGGMIVEYWLNRGQVLRVATAYYAKDEEHYSLEERAVILTAAERDGYHREIY